MSKNITIIPPSETEHGKYSAKYALSELLVCGECGRPIAMHLGQKRQKAIVWRCVSRIEFDTKYCHPSPSMDEDRLHQAILEGINEFVQAGQSLKFSGWYTQTLHL